MEEDYSKNHNILKIASAMFKHNLEEDILDEVGRSICCLMRDRYSNGIIVPGFNGKVYTDLHDNSKQKRGLFSEAGTTPSYGGIFNFSMPRPKKKAFDLQVLNINYSFDGFIGDEQIAGLYEKEKSSLRNQPYSEHGWIYFSARKDHIFNSLEGLSAKLKNQAGQDVKRKTLPYVCLIASDKTIRGGNAMIMPNSFGFLVKDEDNIVSMNPNSAAKMINDFEESLIVNSA
jgi:hypothetical protein